MKYIGLTIGAILIPLSPLYAACPAAPTGNATDMIVRFVAPSGGHAGTVLASSIPDKTTEGTFLYDTTAKTLKLCNGATWLDLTASSQGITALTGNVTASGTGSVVATIANSAVTNAKLANMAANTIKGNNTASAAAPTDLTVAQLANMIIPTGAIWAFDLAACPTGWAEYTPARGRFLRGIDSTGTIDSGGTRAAGNLQADALQNHSHYYLNGNTTDWNDFGAGNNLTTYGHGMGSVYTTLKTANYGGDANWASETRPKNVAVLYCRKT